MLWKGKIVRDKEETKMLTAILISFLLPLIISTIGIKYFWTIVVQQLFPGAVEQGLIAREISWFTAMKVAIFVALISGFSSNSSSHHD